MSHGNRRREAGERAAKRARRVALDGKDGRPVGEQRGYGAGNVAGMGVGIAATRAGQRDAWISLETIIVGAQRMLRREDQPRLEAATFQCGRDGR